MIGPVRWNAIQRPIDVEIIYAVLDRTRAMHDTRRPIVSVDQTRKGAEKACNLATGVVVATKSYRQWAPGDHPSIKSDMVHEKESQPNWRGIFS